MHESVKLRVSCFLGESKAMAANIFGCSSDFHSYKFCGFEERSAEVTSAGQVTGEINWTSVPPAKAG